MPPGRFARATRTARSSLKAPNCHLPETTGNLEKVPEVTARRDLQFFPKLVIPGVEDDTANNPLGQIDPFEIPVSSASVPKISFVPFPSLAPLVRNRNIFVIPIIEGREKTAYHFGALIAIY